MVAVQIEVVLDLGQAGVDIVVARFDLLIRQDAGQHIRLATISDDGQDAAATRPAADAATPREADEMP